MMIDMGIVGCIGLVLTDWIMHHSQAIKCYIKEIVNMEVFRNETTDTY